MGKMETPLNLARREHFALVEMQAQASFIAFLFFLGRPFTIFRAVSLVVVHSLKRMSGRPRSHILQKQRESPPPFADFDATPAIRGVRFMVGIVASPEHRRPRNIFRSR